MRRANEASRDRDGARGPNGRVVLRAGVATHAGRVREQNEDRPYADAERGIFLVVDGLGGHAAGETAAETAVALLRQRLERPTGTPEERVREAIAVANNEILAQSRAHPDLDGMGCVLTVAVVENGAVTVGHVGDSRLYRLGRGRIEKVTRDHSPIGLREDLGELGEREAMSHPRRNEVYRALGQDEHGPLDPDFIEVTTLPLAADEALLLCSDGLTDLVASDGIRAAVTAHAGDPTAIAERLVQAALTAGGKDNVSVVFAEGPRFATEWRRGPTTGPVVNPPAVAGAERIDGRGDAAGARAPASRTDAGPAASGAGLATRDARERVTPDAVESTRAREQAGASGPAGGALAPGPSRPATAVRAMAARWWQSRWIQFALGGACGAAIALAVPMLGPGGRDRPTGVEAPPAPRTLDVGRGQRFGSITDALGAARPGDTVRVAPGVYRERVRLESGVHLVAAVPRQAVLSPAPDGTALVAVVGEGLGGGSFVGFSIRGGAPSPIDVGVRLNDAAVTLDDLDVSGARVAGVVFEGGGRVSASLRASAVHDNPGAGVIVRAGATARLAHNHVVDNGRGARTPAPGVDLERGARAELTGNVFAGNGGAGVRGVTAATRASVLAHNLFAAGGRASRPSVAAAP